MADPELARGEWFACHGYWVFPYSDRFLSVISRNLKEVKKKQGEFAQQHPQNSSVKKNLKRAKKKGEPAQQHPPTPSDWVRRFKVLDRQAQSAVQWLAEIGSLPYNAQPNWSLRELRPSSLDEACAIIKEFLGLAKLASEAFDWGPHLFLPKMRWMEHSWKHISMADLERIASDVRSGIYPFPDLGPPIDLFETGDDTRQLFLRAAQRDPSAVTRLNVLFPSKQTQREVAELYFVGAKPLDEIQSMVSGILTPEELAAEYTRVARTYPDSEEAEKARNELGVLAGKAAVKGSTTRPRIPFGEETVTHIYRMSYALFKQAKEVNRLLSNTIQEGSFLDKEEKRDLLLREFYPWLTRRFPKPHDIFGFLQSQPTAGACKLAGIVLEISPSKVSKIVFK
jgi:hypothetical protein